MLVQNVTRHQGRPVAKTEALELNNLANKAPIIVLRDFSFVATVKSVMNFSTELEKEHGTSFLAAHMVHIVKNIFFRLPDRQWPSDILALYPEWKSPASTPQLSQYI